MTQIGLAAGAGVSESTVQLLEAGEGRTRLPRSLPSVERALGWAPGSAVVVLEGGDPEMLPEEPPEPEVSPQAPSAGLAEGMPARVGHELSSGRVVDTEVAEVSRPGSRSRFILVWKTNEGGGAINPEDLEEWTRLQRALRGLPSEPPRSG